MNVPVFLPASQPPAAPPAGMPAEAPVPRPPRTWTARRNEEVLVQVWRVIANSGPLGISPTDIRDRMNNIDPDVLKQHLHELARKGHTRYHSPTRSLRYGCWVATTTPWPTEDPPAWQRRGAEEADDNAPEHTAQVLRDKAEATVQQALATAPRSVFGIPVLGTVDIDAVHAIGNIEQASDNAAQPAAHAEAPPAEPAPASQIDAGYVQAAPAANAPAAEAPADPPPSPATADKDNPIVVALDNHGRLLVHETGTDPVVLSRQATGALFRYLDRTLLGDPTAGLLTDALP